MRHHFTCDSIDFHSGQYSKMMNLIRLINTQVSNMGGGGVKGKTGAQFCTMKCPIFSPISNQTTVVLLWQNM